MANIVINGKHYSGSSILIRNNEIVVDGQKVQVEEKTIGINIDGNVEKIEVDMCEFISVDGTVGSIQTQSGDVECNDVLGSVSTMSGNINCESIKGGAQSMSGSVNIKNANFS